jgi:acetylornithine deacetylase
VSSGHDGGVRYSSSGHPSADAIRGAVGSRADEILEWTKTLIRFPSENRPPTGGEAEIQEFLAEECRREGWKVDLFAPDELPGIEKHPYWLSGREYTGASGTGSRRNLVATWKGRGSRGSGEGRSPGPAGRSLLFSSHADVAPFEPDNWSVCRPYEPVLRDGRLYGRGSADLKGGMAASFWALKILGELGFEPAGDLLFESVVDEEFAGGNGTLAARLRGYNGDLAVVTEPTRMQVCPACLGAFLGDLTLRGRAGMPYMGEEIANPIFGASRAVDLFRRWQTLWRERNDHPLFREPGKELNVVLWMIDSKREGEFTQMGTPLLTRISWIVWCYPGMSEEEFWSQFRQYWQEAAESEPELKAFALELIPAFHYVRPWETPVDDPAVQQVVQAFRSYTGDEPVVGGAPFSCDLGLYGDPGGMPCLLLGPRGDNLHAPDEWVLLEDVYALTGIYAALAASWSG